MSVAISIVITTYNRARLLPRAVESVLAQTYGGFELIVVDDGSTDATGDLVGRWADARIRWSRVDHGGVSRARNHGLEIATGEWVAFLDDDNEWRPDYVERQLAHASTRPDADVVYCVGELYGADGTMLGCRPETFPTDVFAAVVAGWSPLVSATIMRRSLLESAGGYATSLESRVDIDLWLRVSSLTPFAGHCERLLLRHQHDGARLSLDPAISARSGVELDRRWRREMIAHCGARAHRRFFRRCMCTSMNLAPESEQRAAAAHAARRLVTRLPWSATAIPFPLLLCAIGPHRYRRLRSGYRRLRHRFAPGGSERES
ncbi:MAG: glycosyltransferase family 2 protein [Ilumatobacteraceae bacterium]